MRRSVLSSGAIALVLATGALSACSSNGSSGGTSTYGLKGTPIKIMGTNTQSGTSDAYPEAVGAMQAAVDTINASGGINGHPLQLSLCDDQDDANVARSCAQQAVSNHDVAVVGPLNTFTNTVIPVLQSAGIPFVGQLTQTPLDTTSPISFPLAAGGLSLDLAAGQIAKNVGCKSVGAVIIQISSVTPAIEASIKQGLSLSGVPYAGAVYAPASQTDLSSAVGVLRQKNVNCVASAIAEQQTTGFLSALHQSGSNMIPIVPGLTLAPLSQIGAVATGTYVYSGGRLPSDPTAGVQKAVAQIKKYASGTAITETALEAYAGVLLVADGLRNVQGGSYTAATTLSAMNNLTDAQTDDIFPPYTTTKLNPTKGLQRLFNDQFVTYKVTGNSTQTIGSWQTLPGL